MNEAVIDTTFLIDLQRSPRNAQRKKAISWLQSHPNVVLKIPAIVLGEFGAGFSDPDDPELVTLRKRYEILKVGSEEAGRYSQIYRQLKEKGELIGGNDLWIAAITLRSGLALVTRNPEHFQRVEGLTVETY